MSRWEGKELLQPITAEEPCGQSLEDTPLLASFDTYRLFGQSTPLDPVPEWAAIKSSALEALGKSKDLRLLAHLGTALLRTDGLPAFSETLTIASHWLTTYWAKTYPLVDEDAVLRRNALNCFADPMAVVDGVRRAPLVSDRQHGTFSLRDIDGDARPDPAQVDAAFAAVPLDELVSLQQSIARSREAIQTIDGKMREEAGSEAAPAFDLLSAQLLKIDRVLRGQLAQRPDAAPVESLEGIEGAGVRKAATVGAIQSRQDAVRALDAVATFFRSTEPSSPIPMLLDRAKRLISKDFLEVLADIAPEALAQARAAGGLRQE
jgi:type VI secretion system protein ImpA